MHTSIAFVTILLALREQSYAVKYFFTILNIAIIISTVYLGIHWVIDIIGGIVFGYITLKVSDKIMAHDWNKQWVLVKERLESVADAFNGNDMKQRNLTSFFWWGDK